MNRVMIAAIFTVTMLATIAVGAETAGPAVPVAPPISLPSLAVDDCSVTPDEVDKLVKVLEGLNRPYLRVDRFKQYMGRSVYALTFANLEAAPKRRLFVSRPHAHEPAGVAAIMALARILADDGEYGAPYAAWRDWALKHFVITLVPDTNPGGSQRAPVKFWDGSLMTNKQFKRVMFGESGTTKGEQFPRVAAWDAREVTFPRRVGIAYEQIDEYTYVEPNRDTRAMSFKSFFALDEEFHYDVWMSLHQTEFLNSDLTCKTNLSTVHDELPVKLQDLDVALGNAILARWRKVDGVRASEKPMIGYNYDADEARRQKAFLSKVWRPIYVRMVAMTTEVHNNNPVTPPELQVRLQLLSMLATLDWMAEESSFAK